MVFCQKVVSLRRKALDHTLYILAVIGASGRGCNTCPDFFCPDCRTAPMSSTKNTPTYDLSKQTLQALEPYINIWGCGEWAEYIDKHGVEKAHPMYMITQEQWALFRRYQVGERTLTYDNGHPFEPKHIGMGKLSAKHIDKMINSGRKYYQTSGKNGKALAYLDYDDHYTFQTDSNKACKLLTAFLGEKNLFTVQSQRGINQHIKVYYGGTRWAAVNRAILDLGRAANRYVKARGIFCDVETKGTIQTDDRNYGSLAKLPCFGDWTFEKLDQFKATPEKTLGWLQGATAALIEATDQAEADRQIALCEALKKSETFKKTAESERAEKEAAERRMKKAQAEKAVLDGWKVQREADRLRAAARQLDKCENESIEVSTFARPATAGLATGGGPESRPTVLNLSSLRAEESTHKKMNLTSSGSVTNFPIDDKEMALVPKMMQKYRSHSYYLFSVRREDTYRAGRTIKALDFQQALTVMNLMAIIPNKWDDNQAATGRAKAFWNRLYQEGHFTRAWDSDKWKLLRNTIVDAGFVTLLDERYWFAPGEHSGKAMEWHLNEDLQIQFLDLEEKEKKEASMNVIVSAFVPNRWRPTLVFSPKWRLDTGQDPGGGFQIDEIDLYQRFKTQTLCAYPTQCIVDVPDPQLLSGRKNSAINLAVCDTPK